MTDGKDLETKPKLHVILLVVNSYRTVFGNVGVMGQMIWLAVGFGIANFYLQLWDMQQANPAVIEPTSSAFSLSAFIVGALSFLLLCGVTVAVTRFVLLGEMPTFPGFGISKRELRFAGYSLVLYLTLFLVFVAFMTVFWLLLMVIEIIFGGAGAMFGILSFAAFGGAGVVVVMLLVRLSFVMPAIAMDQDGGLQRRFHYAWVTTKGHVLRMFAALFLGLLPWMALNIGLSELYMFPAMEQFAQTGAFPFAPFSSLFLIVTITGWTSTVLSIVMFAHAYRTLEDMGANGAKQPVEV